MTIKILRKHIIYSLILLVIVSFMPACSMSIVYPQDKIDALPLPEKTIMVWKESALDIGGHRTQGLTTYLPALDLYIMEVPKGAGCIYLHEHKHASGDMTHDGWPKWLMECKA